MYNRSSSLVFSGKLQKLKGVDNLVVVGGMGGICTVMDTVLP